MPKAAKKVVIFLVEGAYDEIALFAVMEKIFEDTNAIRFHICHGDITAKKDINEANVLREISKIIRKIIDNDKLFNAKDIQKIIHLIDTDGAFIPLDSVRGLPAGAQNIIYGSDYIEVANVVAQRSQMASKKRVVTKLNSINELTIIGKNRSVPYQICYFSRNLEHVLWDKSNVYSQDEKRELAEEFDNQYANAPDDFIRLISGKVNVPGAYKDTWDFIFQGFNSLHRHTNLFHSIKPFITPPDKGIVSS